MIGIDLSTLAHVFTRVPAHRTRRPDLSFDALDALGEDARDYMTVCHSPDLAEAARDMPLVAFHAYSRDQLCKLRFGLRRRLSAEVETHLAEDAATRLLHKIESSAWKWGLTQLGWNEALDALDGIRGFDLGVEGLSVTLDHTPHTAPSGWSEHSQTYLDGVFALLVHHRGQHVMTIGFSITGGHRLLLQQIQLKRPRGNRWLFSLPANRVEFVVDRLRAAFPRHRILVADAADVGRLSLGMYGRTHADAAATVELCERRLADGVGDVAVLEAEIASQTARRDDFAGRIERLRADMPRLSALYADAGRHARTGRTLRLHQVTHHLLAA